MAISYVSASAASGNSASNNPTLAYAQNVVAGNLLVVTLTEKANAVPGTPTDTQGNQYFLIWGKANGSASKPQGSAQYGAVALSSAANTVTFASTAASAYSVQEYAGLYTAVAVDKTVTASSTTGTSLASGTTSATVQANELIVGAGGVTSTETWSAPTTGYAADFALSTANSSLDTVHKIVSATGTQTCTFTGNTSSNWAVGIGTLGTTALPTFVQNNGGSTASAGATSVALSWPAAVKKTDLLILTASVSITTGTISGQVLTSITDSPNIWVCLGFIAVNTKTEISLWACLSVAGTSAPTLNLAVNAAAAVQFNEYTGITASQDQTLAASGTGTSVSQALTTARTNEFAIAAVGDFQAVTPTSFPVGAGWTSNTGGGGANANVGDINLFSDFLTAAGAVPTPESAASQSTTWGLVVAALQSAIGPAPIALPVGIGMAQAVVRSNFF